MSRRPLLNALQKAQADAIDLIAREMSHHALCWRSIYTVPGYTQLVVSVLRSDTDKMEPEDRRSLADGLEWLQINLDSANAEIVHGFRAVSQRTVVVLADIIENLVESTLGICLLHLDPMQTSIKEVTSFKRQAENERMLKQAVRAWESKLYIDLPNRTDRIAHMIEAFFPSFQKPADFQILDELFSSRNRFTHELIKLDDTGSDALQDWSLSRIDGAFRVASDFLIAVMTAIPGDLKAPIAPTDRVGASKLVEIE